LALVVKADFVDDNLAGHVGILLAFFAVVDFSLLVEVLLYYEDYFVFILKLPCVVAMVSQGQGNDLLFVRVVKLSATNPRLRLLFLLLLFSARLIILVL